MWGKRSDIEMLPYFKMMRSISTEGWNNQERCWWHRIKPSRLLYKSTSVDLYIQLDLCLPVNLVILLGLEAPVALERQLLVLLVAVLLVQDSNLSKQNVQTELLHISKRISSNKISLENKTVIQDNNYLLLPRYELCMCVSACVIHQQNKIKKQRKYADVIFCSVLYFFWTTVQNSLTRDMKQIFWILTWEQFCQRLAATDDHTLDKQDSQE